MNQADFDELKRKVENLYHWAAGHGEYNDRVMKKLANLQEQVSYIYGVLSDAGMIIEDENGLVEGLDY